MKYNSRYSKKEFYWGLRPNILIKRVVEYLPKGSGVLDLGSGEGRDSLFLSKNNFNVTSIDISKKGIEKLKKLAKKEKLKIKAEVSDLKSYLKRSKKFDTIISMNSLQFIDQKNLPQIIKKIKSKTRAEGFNIIASFIAKNSLQKKKSLSNGRYIFDKGELKEFYKDWKVLFYEEKLGKWETHGEPKHRHFNVRLIAQNPKKTKKGNR